MAEGLSVALPLRTDETDGVYGLHRDVVNMAKQNIKMIILTAPGERIMNAEFGVGIRNYLFQQNTASTQAQIKTSIQSQVAKYLPYITLDKIEIFSPHAAGAAIGVTDNTRLVIKITFSVPAANVSSDLSIPVAA
jgi:phage baseplate assembly protein W